jgi:hypothetical protein
MNTRDQLIEKQILRVRDVMVLENQIAAMKRELNDWRECATKLANATVKAVPLICLDPEERQAGELFDKLTRAAEPSNIRS